VTLVPIDASGEASVVAINRDEASVLHVLERARELSVTALALTGPAEIAAFKAQLVTAQTYAKELRLARGVHLDFAEVVRRFEYELGRSIREGQADGSIASKSQLASYAGKVSAGQRLGQSQSLEPLPKPSDFASESELMGARQDGIYALADNGTPEEFEVALEEAKAEGNPSRANVVRKLKAKNELVVTRDMRAEVIRNLAEQGYSSRQMPAKVGVTEETIRLIARDFDIEIPADRSISRTRRVDSNHIVANTVTALEGLVMGIDLIAYDELDPKEVSQWADSLSHSIRTLNRFMKQIKETAQ
jgi:hypothetical protein